jgi:drug/metabolite transporter (DMT)-like permease
MQAGSGQERLGAVLVFLSALFWSIGGTIDRFLDIADGWTVIFWRSFWAASFLIAFMFLRDGGRGTVRLFAGMGLPGLAVSLCFATASTAFVVALAYTTVANILLMQAGVPLIAALIGWVVLRERVGGFTWAAIGAVIAGVAIMVSDSLGSGISPVGDLLALTIAVTFAVATVITRRFAHVRMTPATCLGTVIACVVAAFQAGSLEVSAGESAILFAFGALNLGLGMALFASGARLVPAPVAALLGTFEPVLGPVWVWLVHGEVPSGRTIIGGTIIVIALLGHIAIQFRRPKLAPARPGVTGMPTPD